MLPSSAERNAAEIDRQPSPAHNSVGRGKSKVTAKDLPQSVMGCGGGLMCHATAVTLQSEAASICTRNKKLAHNSDPNEQKRAGDDSPLGTRVGQVERSHTYECASSQTGKQRHPGFS
ncbi:hypothetical protein D9C73_002355 [Collichthys lucidus]|uniref:Uncharacterized protein n=1 Tax=Collichthys lucidus TaxID=240159 RepID=A0A4U5U2G1_COLLU|nr:hypothetical protein D9C73_002355 [Collichthys lucidus]